MRIRIKVFSIIIFAILIFDFLINIHEKSISKAHVEREDYAILQNINHAVKDRNLDYNLLRIARNRQKPIGAILRTFLERIFYFDQTVAHLFQKNLHEQYLSHVIKITYHKIENSNLLQKTTISDKNLEEEKKNLNIKRYKVYSLNQRTSNYIAKTIGITDKKFFYNNRIDFKFTDVRNKEYFESSFSYDIENVMHVYQILKAYDKEEVTDIGYQVSRLVFSNDGHVGVVTPRNNGYGYFIVSNVRPPALVHFAGFHEVIKSHYIYNYLINTVISTYYDDKYVEDSIYVGEIVHVGNMQAHNIFAGIYSSDIQKDQLEDLIRSCPRSIFNKQSKFFISTKIGVYAVIVEDVEEKDIIKDIIKIKNSALKTVIKKKSKIIKSRNILPITKYQIEQAQSIGRLYEVDYHNLTEDYKINYRDREVISLKKVGYNAKPSNQYNNYTVLHYLYTLGEEKEKESGSR